MAFITTFVYLCWCVIDGDLDGLAGCAHVDHHQDVTVTDLKGGTKGPNKVKSDGKDRYFVTISQIHSM